MAVARVKVDDPATQRALDGITKALGAADGATLAGAVSREVELGTGDTVVHHNLGRVAKYVVVRSTAHLTIRETANDQKTVTLQGSVAASVTLLLF